MSSKRPPPKTSSPSDEWKITDEWGIYDPAKAGMPALFARLGRPILRAAPTNARKERRRARRPERSGEGVGLAIAEARQRAGLDGGGDEGPAVGCNPARAMRLALRAQSTVNALGTPDAAPFVPTPQPPPPAPPVDARALPAQEPAPTKKRGVKKPAAARQVTVAPVADPAEPSSTPAADSAPGLAEAPAKVRARKVAAKGRTRHTVAEALAVAAAATVPAPHVPPAPSPRRPRGPVPLAAWAHASSEPAAPEPRRSDKRGFWRGIFRIPAEVALVEYARGAKIHRLLIEAGDDHLPDFI